MRRRCTRAQGVTVDRAHVLATPHMDRHAAYVGLTRHRDGVALHYGRDDFAEPAKLVRTLGRELAKDTTLDYDRDGEDLVRRYAERRGLNPLRPAREILVRSPLAPEPAKAAPEPTPGWGRRLRQDGPDSGSGSRRTGASSRPRHGTRRRRASWWGSGTGC